MSDSPILKRLAHKGKQSTAYHASPRLERKLAIDVGGYRTAGSGNKNEKGDARKQGVVRIEHKATQHDSFRVTKEILRKIDNAARGCDEIPIVVVEFIDKDSGKSLQSIACIPWDDLKDLINDD